VDHVVEVGGAKTIVKSLQATRQGGLVSVAGILSPGETADLVPLLMFGAKTGKSVLGVFPKTVADEYSTRYIWSRQQSHDC
jgi:hypothetical protein